mmetsp:Transcript_78708/g.163705  ORF Transcript_78708/g.163705 Transcript_78708/m.163705 type:complete len:357 (-) Transcript_78708:10-1080(-)
MARGVGFFAKWLAIVVLVAGILVGIYCLGLWGFDGWDNEFETDMLTKCHVWSILVVAPIIGPVAVVARAINASFLLDFSSRESVKDAVRNSWTNVGVLSALIFTIGVALWLGDVPGEVDDPATQWYLIFASTSTFMSGLSTLLSAFFIIHTDGLSDLAMRDVVNQHDALLGYPLCFMISSVVFVGLSLVTFSYLQYGLSAFLTTALWLLATGIFAWWEYRVISGYENKVDGKRCSLSEATKTKVILKMWWVYEGGEMQGQHVSQEEIGEILPQGGKHWIAREGRLEEVKDLLTFVQSRTKEGRNLKAVVGSAPQYLTTTSPVELLKEGLVTPEPATGRLIAITDKGEKVTLKWSEQ